MTGRTSQCVCTTCRVSLADLSVWFRSEEFIQIPCCAVKIAKYGHIILNRLVIGGLIGSTFKTSKRSLFKKGKLCNKGEGQSFGETHCYDCCPD